MRFVVLAILGLNLAACTVREGGAPTTPSICTEGSFTTLIGRVGPDITPDELPVLYRFIEPNGAVTLDFQPERLNLFTNAAGVVVRVSCG